MNMLAEKTVNIDRPIGLVFKYVTNMERFGDWFPGVVTIESSNNLDHGQVGKEYLETVTLPLRRKRKIRLVVREVAVNRFFATEGAFRPLLPRMEISLRETALGSCELTWRMFSRNDNPIARCTLLPFARHVMAKRAQAGLASLKMRLEGDGYSG